MFKLTAYPAKRFSWAYAEVGSNIGPMAPVRAGKGFGRNKVFITFGRCFKLGGLTSVFQADIIFFHKQSAPVVLFHDTGRRGLANVSLEIDHKYFLPAIGYFPRQVAV